MMPKRNPLSPRRLPRQRQRRVTCVAGDLLRSTKTFRAHHAERQVPGPAKAGHPLRVACRRATETVVDVNHVQGK